MSIDISLTNHSSSLQTVQVDEKDTVHNEDNFHLVLNCPRSKIVKGAMKRQIFLAILIGIACVRSQNDRARMTNTCLHNGCPMSSGLYVEDLNNTIAKNLFPTQLYDNVLQIMSYNVFQDVREQNKERRNKELCDYFTRSRPSIFGLQNARGYQLEALKTCLKDYSFIANVKNYDNMGPMYDPIFYKLSKRIRRVNSGTFWLSKTPNRPGSKLPNAEKVNTCTWIRLSFAERKTQNSFPYAARALSSSDSFSSRLLKMLKVFTGKISKSEHNLGYAATNAAPPQVVFQWFDFYVAVTKLDSADEILAKEQAQILTKHLRNSVMDRRRYPLILMGDLGYEDNSLVYKHFEKQNWLFNTMAMSEQKFPAMSYLKPNTLQEKIVDYVWQNKFISLISATMTDVTQHHRPVFTALLPNF